MRFTLLFLPLLLASVTLLSCSPRYSHPERPESLWKVDYDMCVIEADYAVVFHHYSTTASRPMVTSYEFYSPRYREAIEACMEDKGYTYEDDPKALLLGSN